MRKLFLAVAALGMLATSCTKDDTSVVVAGDSLVSFEVSAPVIGTRADAYDIYGIGEAVEHLHYAVYLTEGTKENPKYTKVFDGVFEDAFAGNALSNTSLNLKLVNDQTYTAIFWADAPGAPYTFDAETMEVTMDPSDLDAQDENLDAFFGHHKFVVAGPTVECVELARPFSQLNIATADIAEAAAAGVVVDHETTTKVQVSGLYTTLNLLSEEVGGAMTELTVYNAAPKAEGKIDGTYEMLSMNYLFVQKNRKLVDVTFDVETKAGQKVNRFFQNVPVERNYRTNILGNLFVDNIGFEVTINPIFDGVIPTTEAEKLQMAASMGNSVYTLTEDAVFNTDEIPFLQVETELTINGDGHKLTSGDAGNYAVIARGENAKVTVNNTNVVSNGGGVGATNGAQVVFNGNKVYVDSPSTSGRYVFYTSGAGSTITINGGEFSWDPADNTKRAYIYADAGTTVYVNGGTFGKASTRSDYKAGIMGPGTVVITGGTFGFDPTKWVADGYFVNKVGNNNWVVSDGLIVNTNEALAAALAANTKVYLANGEYTLASCPAGATIVGYGDNVVLDVQGKKFGVHGNVTIENVKLVFSNANYTGFQHTGAEYYKNCTIVGQPFLYGEKVVFDECTFEQTSANAYNVWTYGAKNVTFNGCTFNSAGKSVLVYCETKSLVQVVTFNDCVLNASAPADGKAAIEIDSSLVTDYTVNINNTEANGFALGSVSFNSLWNEKKGDNCTVYVDGVAQGKTVVGSTEALTAALANAADGATIVLNDATYEGFFSLEGKNVTLVANGENAVINGIVWANNTTAELKGLTLTNAAGAQHPNPTNSKYYTDINEEYPCVAAYLNSNITMTECTFDLVGPTVYGFYGYAENNPVFEGCVFNCNKIRPIASNGDAITVNGCTFNNQYHYAVRIFENAGDAQTVVFTNNVMQGANDKGEFEGINISKKGSTATVVADFTITGNSVAKYRHHKNVTMSDACTYTTDIADFAFESEE